MQNIDWESFPEATHYTEKRVGAYAAYWKVVDDIAEQSWIIEDDVNPPDIVHYKSPSSWRYDGESFVVERPKQGQKDAFFIAPGFYLPSVGTVCEIDVGKKIAWLEWRKCEVVAHRGLSAIAICENNELFMKGPSGFRPLKTQEEIAKEKTIEEIENIVNSVLSVVMDDEAKELATEIYNRGYRKVEEEK
ncbi:hypothetical protein D3C85_474660 [compost metagenome]